MRDRQFPPISVVGLLKLDYFRLTIQCPDFITVSLEDTEQL